MGRRERERLERKRLMWKRFHARLRDFKRKERLKMTKQVSELRAERKEIAAKIMGWRKEISELNRADQQDGIPLGMTADRGWMQRKVERHARVEQLEVEAGIAEQKLARLDAKLSVIEADAAEVAVHAAVKALQNGGSPEAWKALRDNMLMLVHHRRVGQSSRTVLAKIERLSQPGTTHGVRVRENVGDFLMWIKKPAEAAA